MAVSWDLFGTLVTVDRPADPASAIARELVERGVAVPEDWADATVRIDSLTDFPEWLEGRPWD